MWPLAVEPPGASASFSQMSIFKSAWQASNNSAASCNSLRQTFKLAETKAKKFECVFQANARRHGYDAQKPATSSLIKVPCALHLLQYHS
jgi:hypothetical protein